MRVLITGITGFAGSFLAEYCLARAGVEVTGLVRRRDRLTHAAALAPQVRLLQANMRDAAAISRAIGEAAPEVIFHLAGQAFVPQAFDDPVGTLVDNAGGLLHIIQGMLRYCPQARLLVVGSGQCYGLVTPDQNPLDEQMPLRPADPYSVSKAAQELYAYQYFVSHHVQTVRVRPFNHTGPRQNDQFVASRFARQIAEIEAGLSAPELVVGNTSTVRDFTDVRDIARGYFLAATEGQAGEVYNLGSGRGRAISEVLGILAGYSTVHFRIREEASLSRPVDLPVLVCNATQARQRFGWEAQIPFERTLLDLLNYWRQRTAVHPALLTSAAT